MFSLTSVPGMPEFNLMSLLHGTEEIFIEKPLEAGTKYTVQEHLMDFQDKGSGALLVIDSEVRESETKVLQSTVRSSMFIVGKGGFGHKGFITMSKYPEPPKRQPDFVAEEKTMLN